MKKLPLMLATAAMLSLAGRCTPAQEAKWTGSWAAAPVAAPAADNAIGPEGKTYRDIVHLSLGGRAIRLRISNEFGATPLTVGSVHVALSNGGDTVQPASDRAVTFNAEPSVVIPAGSIAISDLIAMPVQPFANLAVSLFVPEQSSVSLTMHTLASSSNYVAVGNLAASASLDGATKTTHWYLLKGVDVDAGPRATAVVVLGASISDGYHSTIDKNVRWPDDLAARLQTGKRIAHIGVLNEGISGNRLLHDSTGPSALARFDRDVLAQSGTKYVIVSLGTNDIGRTFFPNKPHEEVTAEQMKWALQQLVLRAHACGVRVIATTLTPFEGAGYYNDAGEQMRQAFNSYVRTSGIADGVVDFGRAAKDPAHPARLLPAFDSGDHLHPNDAGYKAMADSIDLSLFSK